MPGAQRTSVNKVLASWPRRAAIAGVAPGLSLGNVRSGHGVGGVHFWHDRRGHTQCRADVPSERVVRIKGLRQHRSAR